MKADHNKIIGERIRVARVVKNISQKDLADVLGITFQQFRKYELGMSKISAYKLFLVSRRLNVPLSFFFQQFTDLSDCCGKVSDALSEDNGVYDISSLPGDKIQLNETRSPLEGSELGSEVMSDLWKKYNSMDTKSKEAVLGLMERLSE